VNTSLELRMQQHLEISSQMGRSHKITLTGGAKRFLHQLHRPYSSHRELQVINEEYINHAKSILEDIKTYIASEPTWKSPDGLKEPDEIFHLLSLLTTVLYEVTNENETVLEACELMKRSSAKFIYYKTYVPDMIIRNIRNGTREKLPPLPSDDFFEPIPSGPGCKLLN